MPVQRGDPADAPEKNHLAYISLGSNLGDKRKNLKRAREEINKLPGVRIVAASKLYSTEPQDMKDQPWFRNQVLALSCAGAITAEGLLDSLLYIEKSLGRKRPSDVSGNARSKAVEPPEAVENAGGTGNAPDVSGGPDGPGKAVDTTEVVENAIAKGPRGIDLDLLLFDRERRDSEELRLPHPGIARRAFVLIPLLEIAPGLCLRDERGRERSLESLLQSLPYGLEGDKITQP